MHTTTLEGAHSRGESGRRFGPCTGPSAVQGGWWQGDTDMHVSRGLPERTVECSRASPNVAEGGRWQGPHTTRARAFPGKMAEGAHVRSSHSDPQSAVLYRLPHSRGHLPQPNSPALVRSSHALITYYLIFCGNLQISIKTI